MREVRAVEAVAVGVRGRRQVQGPALSMWRESKVHGGGVVVWEAAVLVKTRVC